MSYSQQLWRNFVSALSGDRLNHMEAGIASAAVTSELSNPTTPSGAAVQAAIASVAGTVDPGGPHREWAPQAALPAVSLAQEGDEVYVYTTAVGYFFLNGAWRPKGTAYTPTAPSTTTMTFTKSTPTYTAGTTPFASVQVNWATTLGTDNINPTGVRLGRDGTDTRGVGATTTDQTGKDGAFTWTNLTPGATYNLTAQWLQGTTLTGSVHTLAVTMPATPPPSGSVTMLQLRATPGDGSVAVANTVTPGTDGVDYSGGISLGRNGTDTNGTGAWSTTVSANSTFVFSFLQNGSPYTFTGDMVNAAGTLRGNPVSVTATPQVAGSGTSGSANVADSGFTYVGTWQTNSVTGGVTQHYSDASGASASVSVTIGTGGGTVSLLATKFPSNGIAGVDIDGAQVATVDLYAASATDGVTVWTSSSLAAGAHTLRVRWTGTKNASSTGTTISVEGASTSNGTFSGASGGGGTGGGGSTGGTTSQKWAAITLPGRGWFSGGAGSGIDDGATDFGTWRGDPTDAISTWQDTPDGGAWGSMPGPVAGFTGLANIAIGGPSNYGAAAGGSLDSALSSYLTQLRSYRTVGGIVRPTIVSPFHELNGNWYAWSVNSGNVSAFQATARRWRNIQQQVFPEAFFSIRFNVNNVGSIDEATIFGNDNTLFDVLDVDWYNNGGAFNSNWSSAITAQYGIEWWRQFANTRGLPMGLPEYGQNPDGGDNPSYINNLIPYIKAHKGKASGQIAYDMYFNLNQFQIYPSTSLPSVASAYNNNFP